ncbi:MAG: hypothetical protein AAGG01_01020, partial [Planctomycetota bacterium]
MNASTHTEVYRSFDGQLKARPNRALTLAWSGVRIGFRRKLPALLLFIIPAIMTIVTSFIVQITFEAKTGNVPGMAPTQGQVIGAMLADQLGDVEKHVLSLLRQLRTFVVLVMGWYGAGLIAEDKRLRASLLYFARPLTRWTYFLGKLGTVMFWGSCAVVLPVIIVSGVAAFASPEWAFVKERWDVIVKMLFYAFLWVFIHALLVLAISSVCEKRNQALAGLFGFYILTSVGSVAMSKIFDGAAWRLISIPQNFERVAESLFGPQSQGILDRRSSGLPWSLEASAWALGILSLACVFVLQTQTRKMEV